MTTGGGGRVEWRGRLRTGGSDVILEGTWVRKNFKAYLKLHSALLTPCVCSLRSAFRLLFLLQILPIIRAGRERALSPRDPADARALPLSCESLDRCVGAKLNGATFSHVRCGTRGAPGAREVAAQAVAAREAGCVRAPYASVLVVSVRRALAVCVARRCWSGVVPSVWHTTPHVPQSESPTPCFHTYHAYDFMFWHV